MTPARAGRLATVVAAASVATACIGGGGGGPSREESSAVRVFGPYRETDADRFVASLESFTERTGIEVTYTGSADFVTNLVSRIGEGNDPPDLAIVPQPGLIRELAAGGQLAGLPAAAIDGLERHYTDETRALGLLDGEYVGIPFRVDVKSLVWYRPDVFAENGWIVPRTLDELAGLTASAARADDIAAWCFTIRAGSATGWPATDWVEDLVVRRAGPEVYAGWSDGSVPFADPAIVGAFEEFRELVLGEGYVDGGVSYAIETSTSDVFGGMFAEQPRCAMVKQADFAAGWLPDGTLIAPDGDVDWFVLPGVDTSTPPPLVVGGDVVVALRRDARVDALLAELAGPDAGESWARAGGFISPKTTFGADVYGSDTAADIAALIAGAPELVFDASDQMPLDVGTSLYWSSITSWIAGQASLADVVETLDAQFAATVAVDEPAPN